MLSGHRRLSTLLALGLILAVTLIGCSSEDELGPREPADNQPPSVTGITMDPATIYPDSLVILTVVASDPNGDRLSYLWDAGGGTIVGDSTTASVTWRAPAEVRSCTVEVVVSDGWRSSEASRMLTITVPPNRAPSTRITRMFTTNRDGYNEIVDFDTDPPTIRDSSLVTLFYEGTDVDGIINGYQYRILRHDIERLSTLAYPFGSFFTTDSLTTPTLSEPYFPTYPFTSNDYHLVVRSRDDDGAVDAHPDSVFFMVNFPPTLDPEGIYPGPDEVIAWSSQESMVVRFGADDVETPAIHMIYRVAVDGVWGARVGPVDEEADLEQSWPMPEPGPHQIEYLVEDPGLRKDRLTVTFRIVI